MLMVYSRRLNLEEIGLSAILFFPFMGVSSFPCFHFLLLLLLFLLLLLYGCSQPEIQLSRSYFLSVIIQFVSSWEMHNQLSWTSSEGTCMLVPTSTCIRFSCLFTMGKKLWLCFGSVMILYELWHAGTNELSSFFLYYILLKGHLFLSYLTGAKKRSFQFCLYSRS